MNAPAVPTARRSPTAGDLATWRAFIETSERLRSVIASRMQAESGLSTGDYAVLLSLSEAPDHRARSSELATQVGWERSRLSHHLGRMENRQLIRRDECATDSRGAEVVLTADGADAFRRASGPHLHAIQEFFVSALTQDQLADVRELTGALADSLDRSLDLSAP
jgi:DNA-binding MarR family transcriptional regulator